MSSVKVVGEEEDDMADRESRWRVFGREREGVEESERVAR
jgi:uncharacterized protein YraI